MTKTTGEPHDSMSPDQGYKVALERIKDAAEGDGSYLNLAGLNLVSLPPEIGRLTALEELSLHDNPPLGLPPEVLGPPWQDVSNGKGKPARPMDILAFYFRLRAEATATPP